MFDGLIELLMQWLAQAFCWLLQTLIGLAVILQGIYAKVMPSIGVPASLQSAPVAGVQLDLFLYFFPGQFFVAMMIVYLTIEFVMVVMIPLIRSFYDLL